MQDSIFTRIIKGEIPSHKVFEDDKTFAFLDIHPIQPGHTLVVPKFQTDRFYDLPDEDYLAVMATVKKVACRLQQVLHPLRVGLQIEGLEVPHAHVHLIPFSTEDEFRNKPAAGQEPDHPALADLAKKLMFK